MRRFSNKSGFTLIEVATVVVIAGIILVGALTLLLPVVQSTRIIETREKMVRIEKILNSYAAANHRLPCPAVPNRGAANPPYGYESGSGANGDAIPSPNCALGEGVVPFRTLGIPESLTRDAWGGPLLYAVNASFTVDPTLAPAALPLIHPQCRTRAWFFETGFTGATGLVASQNRNMAKAVFCCAQPIAGQGLTMLDDVGANVLPLAPDAGPDGYQLGSAMMRPVDPATNLPISILDSVSDYYKAPQVPPANARITAVAYAIISHGPDQRGIFNLNNGTRVNPPAGDAQAENADGDTTYVDQYARSQSQGATQNDDLVVWQTQDSILASQGDSCVVP